MAQETDEASHLFSHQNGQDQASSASMLKLAVFCPQRPIQEGLTSADVAELYSIPQKLEVPSTSTVLGVKQKLEQAFPGGPLVKGQTLLWHGRRLSDDEVVSQVVKGTQQPDIGYVLHLTCPAEMWKATPSTSATASSLKSAAVSAAERLSALSSSLSPSTSPSPQQPIQSSSSSSSTNALSGGVLQPSSSIRLPTDTSNVSPPLTALTSASASTSISALTAATIPSTAWRSFSTHLTALSTVQRADFMGRLSRAERYYATLAKLATERQGPQMRIIGPEAIQEMRTTGKIGTGFSSQSVTEMEDSIEQLLEDLGCMQGVRTAQSKARDEFEALEKTQMTLLGGQTSSRIVYISGYPFLLQIPPQFSVSAEERKEAFVQMRKYQAVHAMLNSMLAIARGVQTAQQGTSSGGLPTAMFIPPPLRARDAHNHQPAGQLPPVAGLAMQQGPNRPNGIGAVGIGAQAAARLAGPGMPTARLAVVINLDEIMALALPLLFLSIKLAFLIYVFGKHATTRKRIAMCAMAFAWVVWEGMSIHRRRRAAETRRQQQRAAEQGGVPPANQQGRAAGADNQDVPPNGPVALEPPLHLNGQPAAGHGRQEPNGHLPQPQYLPPALNQLQERAQQDAGENREVRRRHRQDDGGAADVRRNGRPHGSSSRSSSHRQPSSRLSPKYWLYLMAKVGLSAEARDMGLSRTVLRQMHVSSRQATQNGTPVPPLAAQANQPGTPAAIRIYQAAPLTPQRALRNLYIGAVLFVGTLIPEVERLRKKALLKREKRLAELELTRRQMHLASLQAELQRLEDQRKALEEQMTEDTGEKTTSQQAMREGDSEGGEESSNTIERTASSSKAGGTTSRRSAGLGIDSLPPSDSDTDLFDPPFSKDSVKQALQSDASSHGDSGRSANATVSRLSADGTSGAPQIRINTDTQARNDLLSPLRALQRRDENGNVIADDDYSAPSTPLLSPAMTEEEDDRQDDGQDEDVGMILF